MTESTINLSRIIGKRYDFAFNLYNEIISNFTYPIEKLGDLLVDKPQYGANESGTERKSFEEPRYIRITDINEIGELDQSIGVTANKVEGKYILNNNDIIIARSGATVGKSYIHKSKHQNYTCFFAGYMIRFRVDIQKILPDFFFVYTQLFFYKNWVKAIQRTTGQPNINAEEYKSLILPVPPLPIQQEIINLYNQAYQDKLKKESEAKALLDSIDGYLLKELGIQMPENTSNEKCFKVKISDLVGGKLNSVSYNSKSLFLNELIINNPLDKARLKKCITHSVSGDWGIDENEIVDNHYSKCLVIRSTEFDNKFNLNLDNPRVKYRNIKIDKLKKMDVQANDLLIEKSGGSPDQPVGRIAYLSEEILKDKTLAYSNFIHKIRIDNPIILPEYVYFFLKTMYNIGFTISMQSQTNGIRNLNMSIYFEQFILLPDKDKQIEIVKNIKKMRDEAIVLQNEATLLWNDAKTEIEKIILE